MRRPASSALAVMACRTMAFAPARLRVQEYSALGMRVAKVHMSLRIDEPLLSIQPADPEQASNISSPPDLTKSVRRKGPAPVVVLDGDVLESTREHRLIVSGHYAATVICLAQIATQLSLNQAGPILAVVAACIIFSDFFSGLFHWICDNYGDIHTPLLGGVIAAFQGHHDAPWTITHRPFSNNVHKIAKVTGPASLALILLHPAPLVALFAVLFFNLQLLSQEFHKLSHQTNPPSWANSLQDAGLIVSRREHGKHHSSPFESHYCILTGWCNSLLDETGLFRALERIVYKLTGVEPNDWKLDPALKAAALQQEGD